MKDSNKIVASEVKSGADLSCTHGEQLEIAVGSRRLGNVRILFDQLPEMLDPIVCLLAGVQRAWQLRSRASAKANPETTSQKDTSGVRLASETKTIRSLLCDLAPETGAGPKNAHRSPEKSCPTRLCDVYTHIYIYRERERD